MTQHITSNDIEKFIEDGYLCIENAFPRSIAEEVRKILWTQTGCSATDRATWIKPVIRLGMYSERPFLQACNSSILHEAFDALVGKNRWQPIESMGTFPIRFPSDAQLEDDGWHIDMSFGTENPDFMGWRANFRSKGRALLLLFLFSDVGVNDAPTKIRVGSHLDIARILKSAGEAGMTLGQLVTEFDKTAHCKEAYAIGAAGTVYLCHPFLVHAAQKHRGNEPKFMAQPPLLSVAPFEIENENFSHSPVERAIRRAIGLTDAIS